MNHPEINIHEQSLPSAFNKEGWDGLIALLALSETVEYINTILQANKEYGDCPPVEEYAKAFPPLQKAVQEAIDTVSQACQGLLPQLEKALDQYEYVRLQAIANCSKKDCIDRASAQKELGWVGEKPVLL